MEDLGWEDGSRMGVYGAEGHPVIELHGGPGAAASETAPTSGQY